MKNRCYLCGNAQKFDALYDHLCIRHFLFTSLQIAWLTLRGGRIPSKLFWNLFVKDFLDKLRRRP